MLFCAVALLEQEKREQGIEALSLILTEYGDWFKSRDGREVYEVVQMQRAFSLMHLERKLEALFIVISVVVITKCRCIP